MGKKQPPPATSEARIRGKKKDTRKWCGGHPGRNHVPWVVIAPHAMNSGLTCKKLNPDDWRTRFNGGVYWNCVHAKFCLNCGKFLAEIPPLECPDNPHNDGGDS